MYAFAVIGDSGATMLPDRHWMWKVPDDSGPTLGMTPRR